jgi:tetratricopeptide (TPR) repeat protein
MSIEPQPGASNEACLPEDRPVPRPEDWIGGTVEPDHRVEGIEAIGSKFVVFRLLNLRTGQIDQVAKVPLEEFDPRKSLVEALHSAMKDLSRNPDRMIRICNRLLAMDPACEAAAFNKGVALLAKQDANAALEAFNVALALQPGDVWNLIHRAACFAALGRDAESLRDLQTATGLDHERDHGKHLVEPSFMRKRFATPSDGW